MKVAKPKFYKETFSNAIIREGVEELTLREGEENTLRSFINTANVLDGYIFTVGATTPPSRGGVVPAKFPANMVSIFTITGAFFRRNVLHASGPLPSTPSPSLVRWVAAARVCAETIHCVGPEFHIAVACLNFLTSNSETDCLTWHTTHFSDFTSESVPNVT